MEELIQSIKILNQKEVNNSKDESKKLEGVVLIGAAFKEDTDDLRNSPTTEVFKKLKSSIENVVVFDEIINDENIVKFDRKTVRVASWGRTGWKCNFDYIFNILRLM